MKGEKGEKASRQASVVGGRVFDRSASPQVRLLMDLVYSLKTCSI